MILNNRFLSKISRLYFLSSSVLFYMFLIPVCIFASNPAKPDFWVRNNAGTITHSWKGADLDQSLVMNMQGLKVVMQVHSSFTKGLNYTARFFHVKPENFNKILIDTGTESDPELRLDNIILKTGSPESATFNGMLTFTYPENSGYLQAAHLAHDLGKKSVEIDFNKRADALRKAIEKYFGAEVEGFRTYRYYKENTTLRGWILLPLAMGIDDRQDGTIAALLSDKLWPRRLSGADILAESTKPTEWARETYYALRVLFKAGRTEEALDLTRRVVKAQVFGEKGPYPDEDAIDMLCPGSLYPRIFTEGMFGIVPTGIRSFKLKPWLPGEWPRMALRDLCAFGKIWDLVVERIGDKQKITVTSNGKIIFSGSGPAGKSYSVKF